MKILHCIPTMGGGGAERQLSYLLPCLAERGWEVHCLYLQEGPNLERLCGTPVTLHQPTCRDTRKIRTAREIFSLLRRLKPDLVQTWLLYMDVVAGLACRRRNIPWVMTERSAGPMRHSGFWRNLLRRRIGAGASAIVSNSPFGDAYWSLAADVKTKRRVIPNCLPLDQLAAVEPMQAEFLSPNRKVVLYVGRLDVEKNVETLLPVLRNLLAKRSDVEVVVCGEGAYLRQVRSSLREGVGGDRAHVPGFTTEAWSWMKRADVVVNPSHFEGHPNVVLEAAGLGTPLVVSDIPAHRAFLSEDSALFAPPMDVNAWVRCILNVLDDPDAARCRAERARQSVASLTPEAMADAYDRLYRELLESPSK